MACHKSNYQLKKKSAIRNMGVGLGKGGREGKTNMEVEEQISFFWLTGMGFDKSLVIRLKKKSILWGKKAVSLVSPACNAGGLGLIPGLGRFSGERNGNPIQYSCLENLMDWAVWRVTVHGVAESDMTEWSPMLWGKKAQSCFGKKITDETQSVNSSNRFHRFSPL